jgi:AcrR family transcriptional regulator
LVIHHFGSKDGLRQACDEHVAETIRAAKSESLKDASPAAWLAQIAEIESFAPLTAYLVRALQTGGELANTLLRTMIGNAEEYIEEGVRAGTIKPSRDPKARARFLAMTGAGSLLIYLQMHNNPTDLRKVLHDYGQDMMLPSLEVYTQGLLTDPGMYQAFLAEHEEQ